MFSVIGLNGSMRVMLIEVYAEDRELYLYGFQVGLGNLVSIANNGDTVNGGVDVG